MTLLRPAFVLLPLSLSAALAFTYTQGGRLPQEAPPAGAVAHADRGDAHFTTAWHAARRKVLVETVKNRAKAKQKKGDTPEPAGETEAAPQKAGIIVLRGAPGRRDYQKFRQTNDFYYLTGVEAPGASLVIKVADGKETLFLAPPSFIEGVFDDIRPHAPSKKKQDEPQGTGGRRNTRSRTNVQEEGEKLAAQLGFADLRESTELDDYLHSLAAEGPYYTPLAAEEFEATSRDDATEYENSQQEDKFDGRASRTKQFKSKLESLYSVKVNNLTPALDSLRRIKTHEEIEAMRRAGQIAAAGHIAAMRATKPGLKEWQIGAEATAVFYRLGAPSVSYFPIVGTGRNALILHYTDIGETVKADDVILMDYAPEWHYYASDVTRSWPANGKFSERGKKIYEAVLKAQEAAIARTKPGVSFGEINQAAMDVLRAEGFPPEKYMPHGLSHPIGMTTHDVGSLEPVEPGIVFTIEPGIYDKESGIGVRIEDVIAVTKDGCDNLSKDAPKTVAEIEAIVGKPQH